MQELSIGEFVKHVVTILEKNFSGANVTLENPDNKSLFPTILVSNPTQSFRKLGDNNAPVYTRLTINIEWWTNKKYESMDAIDATDKVLRAYNFVRVGTPTDLYDDNTKKHRFGGRYEVNYNGLTNSFERIK